MSGSFDPYLVWLGIPITEQPPHHYRLLGVPVFEANGMVISLAADRHIGFLESVNDSEHGFLAEQLIKSIDAARICLLDPQRKSTYDAKLRSKLSPGEPTPETAGVPANITPVITTTNNGNNVTSNTGTANGLPNGLPGLPNGATPTPQSVTQPIRQPTPAAREPLTAVVVEDVEPEPLGETTNADWAPVPAWMEDSPPDVKPTSSPPKVAPRPAPVAAASRPPATRPPSRTNEISHPDTDAGSDTDDSLSFLASPGMKSSPASEAVGSPRPKQSVSSAASSAKSRGAVGSSKGNTGGGKPATGRGGKNDPAQGKPSNKNGRMMAIFLPTGIFIVALMVIIYFMFISGGTSKSKSSPKPGTTTSPSGGASPKKSSK